jgi:hypothetical protein
MLSVTYADAECHIWALYAECRYAEYHYAECRYAECRSAENSFWQHVHNRANFKIFEIKIYFLIEWKS